MHKIKQKLQDPCNTFLRLASVLKLTRDVPFSVRCAEAKGKSVTTWIRSTVMAAPFSASEKSPSTVSVSRGLIFVLGWLSNYNDNNYD